MSLRISRHAVKRYRERVGALSQDKAVAHAQMFGRLLTAKPKHLKRLAKTATRRTVFIPTDGCIFVASYGTIVTVLDKFRGAAT